MHELQEAGFARSLESASLVRNVQDMGRVIGRMKENVGQALGLTLERSALLNLAQLSVQGRGRGLQCGPAGDGE